MNDSPFSAPNPTDALVVVVNDAELRALTWVAHRPYAEVNAVEDEPSADLFAALEERGLVVLAGECGYELAATPEGGIVQIATLANIRIETVFRDQATIRLRWYALTPGASVCLRARGTDLWELRALSTIDLLFDIQAQLSLAHRPVAGVPGFAVSLATLESVADHLAVGDHAGAEAALTAGGAPPLSARAATDALCQRQSTAVVLRTKQPTAADPAADRSMVSWFDAVSRGNWCVPITADDPEVALPFFPAAAERVLLDIGRMLPLDDHDAWRNILVPTLADEPVSDRPLPTPLGQPVVSTGARS